MNDAKDGVYDGLTYDEAINFGRLDRWWKGKAKVLLEENEKLKADMLVLADRLACASEALSQAAEKQKRKQLAAYQAELTPDMVAKLEEMLNDGTPGAAGEDLPLGDKGAVLKKHREQFDKDLNHALMIVSQEVSDYAKEYERMKDDRDGPISLRYALENLQNMQHVEKVLRAVIRWREVMQ